MSKIETQAKIEEYLSVGIFKETLPYLSPTRSRSQTELTSGVAEESPVSHTARIQELTTRKDQKQEVVPLRSWQSFGEATDDNEEDASYEHLWSAAGQ